MNHFLLDTDHFTVLEMGHPPLLSKLLTGQPDEISLSMITVEEALRGRLASIARASDGESRIRGYRRLARTLEIIGSLGVTDYDEMAEDQFQGLRAGELRVGSQDLKIASIALVHSLAVVTRNRRDFGRVPGLMTEDWPGQ